MTKFTSGLALSLEALLDYREAHGFSRDSYMSNMKNFDFYCAEYYPDDDTVSKEMAFG